MFDGFSFDAASRHPSSLDVDYAYDDISPTSSPVPDASYPHLHTTNSTLSMTELSRRFDAYSIAADPYQPRSSFDGFNFAPSSRQSRDWASPASPSPTSAYFPDDQSCPTTSSVRSRRQAHTQLQCDSAHMRDLQSLLKKMVESGDQCVLSSRADSVVSSSESGEEAEEPYDLPRCPNTPAKSHHLRYKRSGEMLSGAAVSKNIRFRRRHSRKMASQR